MQSAASSGGFARWSRHFLALLVQNGGLRALALLVVQAYCYLVLSLLLGGLRALVQAYCYLVLSLLALLVQKYKY
jgi:hypothetical protein